MTLQKWHYIVGIVFIVVSFIFQLVNNWDACWASLIIANIWIATSNK